MNNLDRDLRYAIEVECKMDFNNIVNYEEVKQDIMTQVYIWQSFLERQVNVIVKFSIFLSYCLQRALKKEMA